ncbi:MAG: VWA domain-containing protein [Treponema sp.]|nr:VWA domain-containing protein [Treponema sp.]
MRKIVLGLLGAFLLTAHGLYAQDSRNIPIEVYLIMDGSPAIKNAGAEAVNWVCNYLVDGILRDGDRITIWNAAERAQIVYSDTLSGAEGKAEVKKTLQSLKAGGNQADFSGALREAAQRAAAQRAAARNSSRSGITYTLLISGSSSALSPALLGSGANLLRYSRIEEFPSWRALIVALDINSQVQRAASTYFSGN